MDKIRTPILLATVYLLIYIVAVEMGMPVPIVMSLFFLSPAIVIWMVIRVLKDGTPSEREFTEYFYEDMDMKRNHVPDQS